MLFSFHHQSLFYKKKTVLTKLNLNIDENEKVAIIGKSGSGKTTLLKAIWEQQQKDVAWCPQQAGLVPKLNSLHNIYMGQLDKHSFLINLKQLIHPSKKIRLDTVAILKELDLEECLYQLTGSLSGGQQQRVSIARSIYSQRSIFIGDEPVNGLDEYQSIKVLDFLDKKFPTFIMALHNVEFAQRYAKRIIALKNGEVFFDKKTDALEDSDLKMVYH